MSKRGADGPPPDFIAVGPPRTATTWLHEVMRGRVGLPDGVKETRYFDRHYAKGPAWYRAHFASALRPAGEFCPTYFFQREVRARVRHDLPGCRIVCTLRDPVARLYSHYRALRRYQYLPSDFESAVRTHPQLRESSRYAAHLSGWIRDFGRERVLVLLYDDLERDPRAFVSTLCRFLGVPVFDLASSPAAYRRINSVRSAPRSRELVALATLLRNWLASHRLHSINAWARESILWNLVRAGGELFPPLPGEVEARCRTRLQPEIDALERLLDRDLSSWKCAPAAAPPRLAASA
ncbi:MAG TPA: sulfotransferase [Candidatus Binataceae bacterium]|nr:sulfotransferase [Candidatus Binataceae bacterium]